MAYGPNRVEFKILFKLNSDGRRELFYPLYTVACFYSFTPILRDLVVAMFTQPYLPDLKHLREDGDIFHLNREKDDASIYFFFVLSIAFISQRKGKI